MASEPPQRMENGGGGGLTSSSSRILFQGDASTFPRAAGDGHRFPELRRGFYGSPQNPSWNARDSGSDDDDDEDDVDDDDDLDEGDGEVDGLVSVEGNLKNNNNSSGSVQSSSEKIHGEKGNLHEPHSAFGLNRGGMGKDGNGNLNEQQHQHERVRGYDNALAVVEPQLYCGQMLHGDNGLNAVGKEMGGETGYGFGGRKEMGFFVDPRESLRTHLSDPITGALMDDAIILPCGHSFGSSGTQHVSRMKACCKCSQPISEDSIRPNLTLRAAVQAFRREEESMSMRASKRRRDRFEQDKSSYDDPFAMDSRGKGVQFPFVVSDRVIIKGNKRTPQRFVGRVAVVTTQCLNGWYVVKTLDNAESVKLQYRSLAKVADDPSPSIIPSKSLSPNWL